jgi:arsenate reductase (glutaredoxin)
MRDGSEKKLLGWREWVRLGTLGLPPIKAKIDTGARTSALHAFELEPFFRDGRQWVRFSIHPRQRNPRLVCTCEAPVIDRRRVTDSGGHRQMRYVIESEITLGEDTWTIELTLTCRETMRFRLLLGRTALSGRFLVDPAIGYCIGQRPRKLKPVESGGGQSMSVTIYHNPRCGKSRAALQLLAGRGLAPRVVEYLKTPPSAEDLERLLGLLGLEPRALMRKGEAAYKEAGLDDPALSREDLIRAMVAHPILIERPIVVANGKAAIGRPPEKVLEIV